MPDDRKDSPLVALAKAYVDAKRFGTGYLMVNMDGTIERLDPRSIQIHEDAPLDGSDGLDMYHDK